MFLFVDCQQAFGNCYCYCYCYYLMIASKQLAIVIIICYLIAERRIACDKYDLFCQQAVGNCYCYLLFVIICQLLFVIADRRLACLSRREEVTHSLSRQEAMVSNKRKPTKIFSTSLNQNCYAFNDPTTRLKKMSLNSPNFKVLYYVGKKLSKKHNLLFQKSL